MSLRSKVEGKNQMQLWIQVQWQWLIKKQKQFSHDSRMKSKKKMEKVNLKVGNGWMGFGGKWIKETFFRAAVLLQVSALPDFCSKLTFVDFRNWDQRLSRNRTSNYSCDTDQRDHDDKKDDGGGGGGGDGAWIIT